MFAIKPVIAAIVLASLSASACAQGCSQYPPGKARRACTRANNPNFEARVERCREQGERMGLVGAGNKHHEIRGFMQYCMRGRT